ALHPRGKGESDGDINGHHESQWGWREFLGVRLRGYKDVTTPAFDLDGDQTTFSDTELSAIREIWARVAEDYAPFNLDVTTVDPGDFSDGRGLRVAIGGSASDWLGVPAGGISWIDSFTDGDENTVYVFSDGASLRYIADSCSHEAGHAFGLEQTWSASLNGG